MTGYFDMLEINKIYNLDVIDGMNKIPNNFIDCIITSPPYNLNINYENYNDDLEYNRNFIGSELIKEYFDMANHKLKSVNYQYLF